MQRKTNRKLIKKHVLDIGTVYFYENFLITEINEGIVMNFENVKPLLLLGKQYYGTQTPFIYISNRINSYSFEPTSHFKTVPIFPNIKGYGVVIYDQLSKEIAILEKNFLNIPTNIFYSLEEAIQWAEELIVPD